MNGPLACSKKRIKQEKRIPPSKKRKKKEKFSMQLFSADDTMFSRKNFAHKKLEKPPSKVAHNRLLLFSCTGPDAQTSPELIFHIINMSKDTSVLLSVVTTSLWSDIYPQNDSYYKRSFAQHLDSLTMKKILHPSTTIFLQSYIGIR